MTGGPSLNGLRVLVLEDDYYLATDTAEALTEAGATVVGPVNDPVSAAALAETEELDCAVLDINLGDGPSYEAARALAQRDIPFVFVTGYDQSIIPAEFRSAVQLQKPLTESHVIKVVARLCWEETAPASLSAARSPVPPS